jgi:hypothetical protein
MKCRLRFSIFPPSTETFRKSSGRRFFFWMGESKIGSATSDWQRALKECSAGLAGPGPSHCLAYNTGARFGVVECRRYTEEARLHRPALRFAFPSEILQYRANVD